MREVGDIGAGAAHDFGGMLDQAVELGRQRLDLRGEAAVEAARGAVADAVQRQRHPAQRLKPDAHLEEHRGDEAQAQHHEGPEQRAVERIDACIQAAHVGGDGEHVAAAVVGLGGCVDGEIDAAPDDAQMLAVGTLAMAGDEAVGQERLVGEDQRMIEQRARDQRLLDIADRIDLPITA